MKSYFTLIGLFSVVALTAASFTVNNKVPEKGFTPGNTHWTYEQNINLGNGELFPAEFLIPAKSIKKHPKYSYIRGYNGDIVLRFAAPGRIQSLECEALITNYADGTQRRITAAYSLNGVDYTTIQSTTFKAGNGKVSGNVKLPVNRGFLFVRITRDLQKGDSNGRYGFVLFQKIKIKLTGLYQDKAKTAAKARSKSLKSFFPTGVFWAWERTKPNADFAKKELWAFAEENMLTLKQNGYNTCWFVNFPAKLQLKMLELAKKHDMKVLFNTDLLHIYYNGIGSLESLDELAARTVARIGHHDALLGYVLKDEPVMFDLENCNYLYDVMKKTDPERDSVAVVMNRQSLSYLRDSKMPVICSDIYYFGGDKSTQIPSPRPVSIHEFTNAFKSFGNAAELYGKHSWFMGQMFGDTWGRHWFNGKKMVVYPGSYLHWRMPTEAESRWQIWEALRLGTKGAFFYVLHPPIPLLVPPEKASTAREKKMVASMDGGAKWAASWKTQKLTDKTLEIDPGEGMFLPGGKPTPQMLATGPVMRLIRANESLLVNRRKADFPVFFSGDPKTDNATFISGDRWLGVIVNRDLDKKRTVEVLLPVNVKEVIDLNTGKKIPVASSGDSFRKITLPLAAGDGVLLEAKFISKPGMRFCFESFDQQQAHRVTVDPSNAEIFHHGNFCADENRSLRLRAKGNPAKPVCVLQGLSNKKSPVRTFTKNLSRQKNGITYCLINGKLNHAAVKSDVTAKQAEGENIMHLKNVKKTKAASGKGSVIRQSDFHQPFVVPRDTSNLEFYLGKKDHIEDITIWYVPAK